MPKELKQLCLKNWDIVGVKWGAWSILKNDNVEEDNQLFFNYWIREMGKK